MLSKVRPAQSRRSRVNVIAAPRETLVMNVGTFRIPNRSYRLFKSPAYPVFRMLRSSGFTQRVGHATTPISKDSPDGADLWREHRSCRPSYIRIEKSLTWRISSIESDATALAFLLWLRQRPL